MSAPSSPMIHQHNGEETGSSQRCSIPSLDMKAASNYAKIKRRGYFSMMKVVNTSRSQAMLEILAREVGTELL